jgi:hypothetical protein
MTEKEPIRKYKTVDNTFQIMCYKKNEKCGMDCPEMQLWRRVAAYKELKYKCYARNGSDEWDTIFAYDDSEMMFS